MTAYDFTTSNGFAVDPTINGLNAFNSIEGLVCLNALYFDQDGVSERSGEPQSFEAVTAFLGGFSSSRSGGGLAYLDRLTSAGNNLIKVAGGLRGYGDNNPTARLTTRARRVGAAVLEAWKSEYLYRSEVNSVGKTGRAVFADDGFGKPKLMRGRYPELIRIRRAIDADKRAAEDRLRRRLPIDRHQDALRDLTAQFRKREGIEYMPIYKAEVREVIRSLKALVKPLATFIEPRLGKKFAEFEPTTDFVSVADMRRLIDLRCGRRLGLGQRDDLLPGYVRVPSEPAEVSRAASVRPGTIRDATFPDHTSREEEVDGVSSASRRVNNAGRAVESPGIDRQLKGLLPNYMLGKGKRDTAKRQPTQKVNTRALKAFMDDRRAALRVSG